MEEKTNPRMGAFYSFLRRLLQLLLRRTELTHLHTWKKGGVPNNTTGVNNPPYHSTTSAPPVLNRGCGMEPPEFMKIELNYTVYIVDHRTSRIV
jgi:hypothetical protein